MAVRLRTETEDYLAFNSVQSRGQIWRGIRWICDAIRLATESGRRKGEPLDALSVLEYFCGCTY